jgi:hypothetical protein
MVGAVDQTDDAAVAAYADAVDMAVRVPKLAGVVAGLVIAAIVTAWRFLRRRTG